MNKWDFLHDYFVILTVDEVILFGLVFDDSEFAVDIIRKLIIVSVEMIFRNVEQHSYVWPETADIIELKRADL
jgi:hypothetical protein